MSRRASTRLALGSSCSISGNFFISSPCFRFSSMVAEDELVILLAVVLQDEADLLPRLTSIRAGSKSIVPLPSSILTSTVRAGFFGSPGCAGGKGARGLREPVRTGKPSRVRTSWQRAAPSLS